MPQEVLLTSSAALESAILLYDLHTSNHIQSFRECNATQSGVTTTTSKTQFLTTLAHKGLLHVYSWGKDTPNTKMILPGKVQSLKTSPSGKWCVGGSDSGKLFLWEV
jgi:pre-rRNA-processing protein IPI3